MIDFNFTVVINYCNGWACFSHASLCSTKYVVVKTLTEKKQPATQIKRPPYPILVTYH